MPGFEPFVGYEYDPNGSVCGALGNCFSESGSFPTATARVDPNIKHPRVDEWTVGIERAITNDLRISATGIWRSDKNMQGTVYPDARWQADTVFVSEDGNDPGLNGNPLGVFQWTNVDESENNYLLTNPDGFQYLAPDGSVAATARAERTYKSLMLVLDKRYSNRWSARVSYVYSQSEGTINNTSTNTFSDWRVFWQTPTISTVNTFGPASLTRPHELKVFGSYQIPKIELIAQRLLPLPQRRGLRGVPAVQLERDQLPLEPAGASPTSRPRGDRRMDSLSILDLRIEKNFGLGEGNGTLGVYADIQNMFNAGTADDVNARYPQASVVAPRGRRRGRDRPHRVPGPDPHHPAPPVALRSPLELLASTGAAPGPRVSPRPPRAPPSEAFPFPGHSQQHAKTGGTQDNAIAPPGNVQARGDGPPRTAAPVETARTAGGWRPGPRTSDPAMAHPPARRPPPVPRPVGPAAAAGLLDEADLADRHPLVRRLHHVVDGEGGHAHRVQRLHLGAGPRVGADPGLDDEAVPAGAQLHVHVGEGQGVAEGDRVGGALGGQDPGEAGHLLDRALLELPARTRRIAAGAIVIRPRATASRAVTGLSETSTMRARPVRTDVAESL